MILESVYSELDGNLENVCCYHTTSGLYKPVTNNIKDIKYSLISETEENTIIKTWSQRIEYSFTYFNEYTLQNN